MHHVTIEQARAATSTARQAFERLADITGIGIIRVGDDYGIMVNVRDPLCEGADIPTQVDGVPVSVHVTGEIRPLMSFLSIG